MQIIVIVFLTNMTCKQPKKSKVDSHSDNSSKKLKGAFDFLTQKLKINKAFYECYNINNICKKK